MAGCGMKTDTKTANNNAGQISHKPTAEETNGYGISANISFKEKNIFAGDIAFFKVKISNRGEYAILGRRYSCDCRLVVKQGYDTNNDGSMLLKNVVVENWVDDAGLWYIIGGTNGILPSMTVSGSDNPVLTTGQEMEIRESIMIPTPGVYEIYVLCTFLVVNERRGEKEKEITIRSNMYEVHMTPLLGTTYESILRHKGIRVGSSSEPVSKQ